jgi:2-hydroxyacyl-CoA lyase 1
MVSRLSFCSPVRQDPKDLRGALDEAMNFRGPALVNVVISQGSARKPQQFRWHS